jgi:hypothetical protein
LAVGDAVRGFTQNIASSLPIALLGLGLLVAAGHSAASEELGGIGAKFAGDGQSDETDLVTAKRVRAHHGYHGNIQKPLPEPSRIS